MDGCVDVEQFCCVHCIERVDDDWRGKSTDTHPAAVFYVGRMHKTVHNHAHVYEIKFNKFSANCK